MKAIILSLALIISTVSIAQNSDEARKLALNGLQLVEGGDFESGIKLLKKARNKAPEVYDYSFEIGRAYMLIGKYRLAEKHLYQLQFHENVQADVFIVLAECYAEMNELRSNPDTQRKKELNALRTGAEKLPRSGILYLELAKRQLEMEQPKKALAALDAGIKMSPSFSENYFWASKIYALSGQNEKAWLNAELFYNMTDDIEMARTAALTIRNTTQQIYGSESGQKNSTTKCTCSELNLISWKRQRACLSNLKESNHNTMLTTLTSRLAQLESLGFLDAYVASIYVLHDKGRFMVWLAANGELFESYRHWRNWNPLTIHQ